MTTNTDYVAEASVSCRIQVQGDVEIGDCVREGIFSILLRSSDGRRFYAFRFNTDITDVFRKYAVNAADRVLPKKFANMIAIHRSQALAGIIFKLTLLRGGSTLNELEAFQSLVLNAIAASQQAGKAAPYVGVAAPTKHKLVDSESSPTVAKHAVHLKDTSWTDARNASNRLSPQAAVVKPKPSFYGSANYDGKFMSGPSSSKAFSLTIDRLVGSSSMDSTLPSAKDGSDSALRLQLERRDRPSQQFKTSDVQLGLASYKQEAESHKQTKVLPAVLHRGLVGLPNRGATCYRNVVLQSLFFCEPFAIDLVFSNKTWLAHLPTDSLYGYLTELLCIVRTGLYCRSEIGFLLKRLHCSMRVAERFPHFRHQDAQEYLTEVLQQLSDEVSALNVKLLEAAPSVGLKNLAVDPVKANFTFEITETLCCSRCGSGSRTVEQMNCFSLGMPNVLEVSSNGQRHAATCTLQDVLDYHFEAEHISRHCKCGSQHATVQRNVTQFSRVVIVHVERCSYGREVVTGGIGPIKNEAEVLISRFICFEESCAANTPPPKAVTNLGGRYSRHPIPRSPKQQVSSLPPASPESKLQPMELLCRSNTLPVATLDKAVSSEDDNRTISIDISKDVVTAMQTCDKENLQPQQAVTEALGAESAVQDCSAAASDKENFQPLQRVNEALGAESSVQDFSATASLPGQYIRSAARAKAQEDRIFDGSAAHCYELAGVINHVGDSTSYGHFICDVLDIRKNLWLTCDDSSVAESSLFETLSRTTSAYVLVYLDKHIADDMRNFYGSHNK